jgi:LPPG:FO 2-phospho-L-lactate transferase
VTAGTTSTFASLRQSRNYRLYIGGQAVSGPAGRLMAARGLEVSALGVAAAYAPWLDALLVDTVDAALASSLEARGVRPVVTDTFMRSREGEIALARRVLEALR